MDTCDGESRGLDIKDVSVSSGSGVYSLCDLGKFIFGFSICKTEFLTQLCKICFHSLLSKILIRLFLRSPLIFPDKRNTIDKYKVKHFLLRLKVLKKVKTAFEKLSK